MTERAAGRFRTRLLEPLRPDGWRPSGDEPVVIVPCDDTFVRELANGWVAVVTARWHDRDEIELPSWLPGMHGVITVESSATFPAAERLGARLGLADPSCGLAVAPPFVVPGQEPGYRQFRGPEDHERVVAEIARYAEHVLVPAAERGADLDGWMAASERLEPSSRARKVPVMLLAHGRVDQALHCLDAASHGPGTTGDDALDAFTMRFEAFARSGEAPPTDGEELTAVAERRAAERMALVVAAEAEAELENAGRQEVGGGRTLSGRAVAVALVVFFAGKGAQVFDVDLGWTWLPAAMAMVAFVVLQIAAHTEQLREQWGSRAGSADRVHEYLERQRRQRSTPTDDEDETSPGNLPPSSGESAGGTRPELSEGGTT